jgi:hypothetical protein
VYNAYILFPLSAVKSRVFSSSRNSPLISATYNFLYKVSNISLLLASASL